MKLHHLLLPILCGITVLNCILVLIGLLISDGPFDTTQLIIVLVAGSGATILGLTTLRKYRNNALSNIRESVEHNSKPLSWRPFIFTAVTLGLLVVLLTYASASQLNKIDPIIAAVWLLYFSSLIYGLVRYKGILKKYHLQANPHREQIFSDFFSGWIFPVWMACTLVIAILIVILLVR